jgi:hypothetical protein
VSNAEKEMEDFSDEQGIEMWFLGCNFIGAIIFSTLAGRYADYVNGFTCISGHAEIQAA